MNEPSPGQESKQPRFFSERAPTETWNRTLPSISISQSMYEAIQELAMSPDHEFGGRVAPVVREALEEFIDRYGGNTSVMTVFRQMKGWRDLWVDEMLAGDLMANISNINESILRWIQVEDRSRVLELLKKMMFSFRVLPDEWRTFVRDEMGKSEGVVRGIELLMGGSQGEREEAVKVHEAMYGD